MRTIGRHPQITTGDVRRLVTTTFDRSGHDLGQDPIVRLLPGGYAGAMVALVWSEHLDPIVLKAGDPARMRSEHENRFRYAGEDRWLGDHGLDGVYGPVEVELEDKPAEWAVIVYRYIGGKSFEELENFSDFEKLVRTYLWSEDRDKSPSEATLRECFRTIAETLAGGQGTTDLAPAAPLVKYLPELRWDTGILAAVNTARSFCPDLPELVGLRQWWEERIAAIRVAPVHDDRLLHGDVRFANVLVDQVHSEVHLIDFGNGRQGHVFQDFARFEIDLVFRTTPQAGGGAELDRSKLLASVEYLLRDELVLGEIPADGSREIKCLSLWRQVMHQSFPQLAKPGALMMYRWFLLCECLKQLRWVAGIEAGDEEPDSASLIYTICALRRYLSGATPAATWISTAPQVMAGTLHCRAVFVPIRGSERLVNRQRNDAKRDALTEAAARMSTVRLLAETGQSYLSSRGTFNSEIRAVLSTGAGVQVALANPHAPEYFGLSKSYESGEGGPYEIHPDLQRKSTESIQGYLHLREEFGSLIEVRFCRFGVGATILITNDTLFYEPYFRTPRMRRQRLLFDSFEFQFSGSSLHSRSLLEDTFNFHWKNSDGVEDGTERAESYAALRKAFLALWRGG